MEVFAESEVSKSIKKKISKKVGKINLVKEARASVNLDHGYLQTICEPSKKKPSVNYSRKHGYIEGAFWIWGDGKKTHLRFLREGVITLKKLPPGFYKAVESSDSKPLKHMANVAKKRGLKELT